MPKPDVLLPILCPPLAGLLFFTLVEVVCRSLSGSSTRNSPALHTARVHHGQPEAVATRLECRFCSCQRLSRSSSQFRLKRGRLDVLHNWCGCSHDWCRCRRHDAFGCEGHSNSLQVSCSSVCVRTPICRICSREGNTIVPRWVSRSSTCVVP